MKNYICQTCGTEFQKTTQAPSNCPICEDERQFVGHEGQQWTTLEELSKDHSTVIRQEGDGVFGIGIEPSFAIGQRALLVQTRNGNVLWDCIPLVDENAILEVEKLGGIDAIAISHPHFYSGMVQWSHAFGNAPIYLHEADHRWVMRSDPAIRFWSGHQKDIIKGLTLVNLGGHFDGGTVLHRAEETGKPSAIFTGDIVHVVADHRWVSFMYSFPNLIPLSATSVAVIVKQLSQYRFEEIYGAWFDKVIRQFGNEVVSRSAERYIRAILDQPIDQHELVDVQGSVL